MTVEFINTDKRIPCPDCGHLLETVVLDDDTHEIAKVDYDRMTIVRTGKICDGGFHTIRCPECDTLNTDCFFHNFVVIG